MTDDQNKIINSLMLTYMGETTEGKALRSALCQAFLYGYSDSEQRKKKCK